MDRREFLNDVVWMTALAAGAGCVSDPLKAFAPAGAPMQGFRKKPMKKVRVAFVGVGARGAAAVHRVAMIPGDEVVCVCDLFEERAAEQVSWLEKNGKPKALSFFGEAAYREVCARDDVDVVYIATPWWLHAPVALCAMENGKIPLVEVPGAFTVEDCWQLVETSERTRIPCMMLENCCYGEEELLCLNMVKMGLLGEIVHCEGGYLHDSRALADSERWHSRQGDREPWKSGRPGWQVDILSRHCGNYYPTHGLGPIARCMDINRGDCFDYLVSLESRHDGMERYWRAHHDDFRKHLRMKQGDMNLTSIRTMKGCSILLEYGVYSPRPYSRLNLVSGSKGLFRSYPDLRFTYADTCGDPATHAYFDEKKVAELRQKHMHPLFKAAGALAKKVGGHGGMDFIMDLRWSYCLQNGLPLDMDVYDLAAWSVIVDLSERSVQSRSKTMDVPDFTRGAWRSAPGFSVDTMDIARFPGLAEGVREDEQARKNATQENLGI